MKTCTSCNREVSQDFVEFKCPGCGKQKIIRCNHCRTTAKHYACSACEFNGP